MDNAKPASAGVRFPPPVIMVLHLLAGVLLSRVVPLNVLPAAAHSHARGIGGALLLGGVVLLVMSMRQFTRADIDMRPWMPTAGIMDKGLYSWTRNPMYLSFAIIYLGIALLIPSEWAVLTLIPALLVIRYYVIAKEERYLEATFGEPYVRYKARVRRWL
ncbi:methyltransferase family protein [Hyalangium minutum]|uniref:methyltransferase family protein n=1 Tax=Hyalangium minutum TaxID=394096 RepID=UPI0004E6874D|nr:isoprenylcysteine carboxylmethyltransferase family protein [Hyalangium minutum]